MRVSASLFNGHSSLRVLLAVLSLTVAAAPTVVRGDALDDVRSRGVLVWGGDQEGGGPYIYPDPDNPERVIGFEVEIADTLARRLGVHARFFQGDWSGLPQFLRNGRVDIILNGYEWTAGRAAQMGASRPYYIYEFQLLAREGGGINSWEDLRAVPGQKRKRVSNLSGSAAGIYLREHWSQDVDVIEYDGNTNAMMQVGAGVDDATLQDVPITRFYREQPAMRDLKAVGSPVAPGHYVIYSRLGEDRLIKAVDEAIEAMIRDGELKRIYSKWGLWNSRQEELATIAAAPGVGKAVAGWNVVRRYGPTLLRAAWVTVKLSVLAMPLAIAVGLLIAVGRLYGPSPLRVVLAVYVELIRGTPIMLQLFVIFFLLPQLLPFSLKPEVAAVVGLAMNYSAYEAEIYRAGLQAIPAGQMEGALALGMSKVVALRRVVVPQAFRIVIPAVTNDFINMFKDTSICSVIAVVELTKQYNILANSTGAILELAGMTAVMYMVMSYPLSLLARGLEKRMASARRVAGT